MTPLKLFYMIKPLVPRRMQVWLRRMRVKKLRARNISVWPIDPKAGQRPPDFHGWPGQKRFSLVLTHDVDTKKGQDRCLDLMKLEKKAGFVSSFNFVPERYAVSHEVRAELLRNGFEIGVHGLKHDGKLFSSRAVFEEGATRINAYLEEWGAVGFRAPSMIRNLEWLTDLSIEYDASSFDTDPFEPQPEGVGTIFPYCFAGRDGCKGYVELPYTLPQDFTVFVLMQEKGPSIWKRKLRWVAEHGGMALLNAHPDYMNFSSSPCGNEEYPAALYREFLEHVKKEYGGAYWHTLPRDMARFWKNTVERKQQAPSPAMGRPLQSNSKVLSHFSHSF